MRCMALCLYSRTAPPREVFDAYYALALEDPTRRLLMAWEGDEAVGFADAHQRDSLMLGKKGGCNSGIFCAGRPPTPAMWARRF